MKRFCLTIAGSDPSSGAGIQADIRTMDRIGIHPFSAITAITYQTATNFYWFESLSDNLKEQLNSVLETYPVEFVKIGMIPDKKSLDIIVRLIKQHKLTAILDPVSEASAGARLSSKGLETAIEQKLFPLVKVLTPNLSEAAYFSGKNLDNLLPDDRGKETIKHVADIILNKLYGENQSDLEEKAVIIKSALESENNILDLIYINKKQNGQFQRIADFRKKKKTYLKGNIHGTGCVFSSAIAAYLAKGKSMMEAINFAEIFFDHKFQKYVELPDKGKVLDLTRSDDEYDVITQIKKIYNYFSSNSVFTKLIPEVRLNISGAIPDAITKEKIAGIEGRITIINGYPYASGEIKFNVSDHTARLILTAKEFDNSINFVMNLKYKKEYIVKIKKHTDLAVYEFQRITQPDGVKKKEHSTMQWLIKKCIEEEGNIPDIIWDSGSIGKEPMIRLFGKSADNIIEKLHKIINALKYKD